MRVRWIADARVVIGFGPCAPDHEYDFEEAVAQDLISQGKVVPVEAEPELPKGFSLRRRDEEE